MGTLVIAIHFHTENRLSTVLENQSIKQSPFLPIARDFYFVLILVQERCGRGCNALHFCKIEPRRHLNTKGYFLRHAHEEHKEGRREAGSHNLSLG